jgi:tryptophan synthase beta chain
MVARYQSVISQEIKNQMQGLPDYVIACVGGGSNAMGAFYHFLDDKEVQLIGVEAAGLGIHTNKTAATLTLGTPGVLHASRSIMMQDKDGQVVEPHSISAGLDYPGIGPAHAWLKVSERARYMAVTDADALIAAVEVSRMEGIIPALETAHAFSVLKDLDLKPTDRVVINLSGRGDKDMNTYMEELNLL